MRGKKSIAAACFTLLILAGGAGGALYKFNHSEKISGWLSEQPSDVKIRVEAAFDETHTVLREGFLKPSKTVYIDALQKPQDRYHLMVNLTPEDYKSVADLSLVIDRKNGIVKASAQGLREEATTALRINGKRAGDGVSADWGGQANLSAQSSAITGDAATICLDIGGYRGGSLSVCHDMAGGKVHKVIFGGLGGGGLKSFSTEIANTYIRALMMMTEQLTAVMMQQVEIIGMFFDAKHQLETQQIFQQLQAQAHKDYHPSEQMCSIGTMVRNLAQTEGHVKLSKIALNEKIRARELASGENAVFSGQKSDFLGRLDTFRAEHCEPMDNAQGLQFLCNPGAAAANANSDIDFTRTVEMPLTLDMDITAGTVTDTERNVFSLLNYLFLAKANNYLPASQITSEKLIDPYQDLRSIAAMRGIARNSMANIISQRVIGPTHANNAGPYMQALLQEFGIDSGEAAQLIGQNPSYFAQMEILTKKLYQHPNFFTNLYDKPANVQRIQAAMKAIKLMQDRDIYNALLRREMLMSMLLEVDVREGQVKAADLLNNATIGFQ